MKLKSVALAISALVLSVGAQAGNLGTLSIPSSTSFSASASTGMLDETWSFETLASSYANATVTNTVTVLMNSVLYGLSNFSATLDGTPLVLSHVITGTSPFIQDMQTLAMTPILIGAGTHQLKVTGTVIGQYGGGYSTTLALAAAPVPEPETYAMMLAGLGALGFLASRRRG
ncbi:FxDxF family PEP-CTERM protein [Ideonella sp. DXS22W]|uniref:FxDxF family PEP-CTERM protein n=1 Tax=Pseudaquabacterium inlustre TaxID=2984192 RepID=A0ABU9CDL6_9BURK